MDTVHECDRHTDRQTDGRTELRSQRPCNAERRTVKIRHRDLGFDIMPKALDAKSKATDFGVKA